MRSARQTESMLRAIDKSSLAVCIVLLLGAGFAKLFPSEGAADVVLLAGSRLVTITVAIIECAVAITLLIPRTRSTSLIFARLLAVGFASYSLWLIASGSRLGCGCLGGWVRLTPWVHLLVVGLFVTALAQVAPPGVGRSEPR